ncbi:coiled-coil domain-containing protein AGAP005037 isoform X5 [Tribolium castaneum]|uniref:coiled-coil domain-containing protein AGAP005037 isoform X5 n=1 Tax=Tribolium castaneum TaxID=7070 RepID=UPI00077DC0CA|nr:PREDICTED: coiled-coil domain-containing protein AGAP005037 isoform X5 [Tribolium castaneum]|eukprot:XP_015835701.1 PREDICTED: coiled-coil domain-containing protein AGAP005037 isoform X5 [Tribolium castaneum]
MTDKTEPPQAGEKVKESSIISTIHRAYKNDDLVLRDPTNRRSFINRSAYAKLHRSSSTGTNRHSVGNLKCRFESLSRENSQDKSPPSESSEEDTKFTPASFGYPKTAKLNPPLIKPKPQIRKSAPKDVNSNVVPKRESSDGEEYRTIVQQSASEESVDKIAKELSNFTMDGKPKKRGSFRKLFLGGLFNKDKKKKEEERKKIGDNIVYNDNLRNESSFVKQAPFPVNERIRNQEIHEEKIKELEQKYAEMHVNRFNQIRQNFSETRDYVPKNTSSSESDKTNGVVARDTPPRAKETYQNIQVVKPKSVTPSPSPRTIERNLNRSNSKEYPDKPNVTPEDTYGTVFDSLEYSSRNGDLKPVAASPKPLSLESTKLRLPSNREIYEPLPRVKSPIPSNRVSTDKIIATELLKGSRSPTPPKRTVSKPDDFLAGKPPMSPMSPRKNEPQVDRIVTNALVHAPRPETPLRAATPVDLRMSVSMKMSPNKKDIRKSVEEYYWKELKKLKEEEDSRLYAMQVNGYFEDQAKLKRSRSLSPSRVGRRSLSLPRDNRGVYEGVRVQPQAIPEDQVMSGRHFVYDQRFVRGSTERRTVDSLQRPIFRRGSLTKQEIYEPQYNKRVSFSNGQQAWPTRNGYVQSPPQRRLDSQLEDEVFVDSPNKEPIYGTRYTNEPIYSNRVLEQFRARPLYDSPRRQLYNYNPQMGSRRSSMEAIPRQDLYVSRQIRRPVSNIPEDYAFQQYPRNSVIYSSRQSMAEPLYGHQKQVTVRNKVCDIYGQIHDSPQSGVVMGQLSTSVPHQPEYFVRGSRLTSSANDVGQRIYEPRIQKFSPNRPLPPPPTKPNRLQVSDTESGSDASEIQRILQSKSKSKKRGLFDEEWNADGKSGRGASGNDSGRSDNEGEVRGRSRNTRRDDPRRHTLGADQQYLGMAGQGGPLSRTMDLEMSSTRPRKGQPRGYPPPSNAMLFDDDPGIMSEVETSSTGFRRGGKQRSSLPVVRTPSKTLERPLGLVFLQYRNETKRALLPNEITSIDTVKALFVRSFPKQLTMEYLDSPNVKIYIHDSSKDMFYELEDLRSHLREIRDRSVLRLFESADVSGGLPMAGIGIAGGVGHFEDPSYFSEPEFDSEYQHQHIHKSKGSGGKAPYYMGSTASLPRGAALLRTYSPAVGALPADRLKSLPTGAPPKPQRAYSGGSTRSSDGPPRPPDRFAPFQRPANPLFALPGGSPPSETSQRGCRLTQTDQNGYMSSPERGSRYEDPYYSQYASRSGSITPVIDEEVSDTELLDDSYSLYGVKLASGGPRGGPRSPFPPPAAVPYDATRLRVENMERQLANLTGLVQKALTQTPTTHLQVPGRENYRTGDEFDKNSSSSSASLPDKSVSFEKSVSFSDEPPDMNSPKQHSPQHAADTKPAKPAIKSSTLPRTSSQERDRLKPAPPPKPASLSPGQYDGRLLYRDLQLTPEMYNQLRGLQKKAKDLRAEVRNLRRMSQAQAHSVRETIRDTFIKIRAMLLAGGEQVWQAGMDQERVRLSREEDLYKQEMLRLEKDLSDLESTVEELRGNVINRKTRVNMSDVENMALVLSKSSKTVADLKLRFPGLQDGMKTFLSSEMEKVMREEKFLKEEPERLESALRRCKKLTGTLVTLKRLASVQEQRLPCSNSSTDGRLSPTVTETPPITPTSSSKPPSGARVGAVVVGGDSVSSSDSSQRPENALDALLDELQTFSKPPSEEEPPPAVPAKGVAPSHPPHMSEIGRKGSMDSATFLPTQNLTVSTATGSLRRLHSYPSGSDTDNSPPIQPQKTLSKPPLPERNAELLQHITGRRVPPPPPPRTSSKSPLASPTSPSLPPRSPAAGLQHIQNVQNMVENKPQSQFEAATQNLGLGTLRRNVPNRSSLKDKAQTLPRNVGSNLQVPPENEAISASNSSSCESVNSQDGTKKSRKEELEQRHQELLKKQKALQEQYARLQQLQRGNNTLAVVPPTSELLKKTGSESNLLQKMGLQMTTSQITGSLTNLPNTTANSLSKNTSTNTTNSNNAEEQTTTTNKVYETDIL